MGAAVMLLFVLSLCAKARERLLLAILSRADCRNAAADCMSGCCSDILSDAGRGCSDRGKTCEGHSGNWCALLLLLLSAFALAALCVVLSGGGFFHRGALGLTDGELFPGGRMW